MGVPGRAPSERAHPAPLSRRQVATLDKRFDKVDTKIDETRNELNAKIDRVHVGLDTKINKVHEDLNAKIDRTRHGLEAKIEKTHDRLQGEIVRVAAVTTQLDERIYDLATGLRPSGMLIVPPH